MTSKERAEFKRYLLYLSGWIKIHENTDGYGVSPVRFEVWQLMNKRDDNS